MSGEGVEARRAAAAVLDAVLGGGEPLDVALDRHGRDDALAPRDQAFARALVSTTLRRLGRIDAALAGLMRRPAGRRAGPTQSILRLGAAQILFMNTPAYAAVDVMTTLAASHPKSRPFKGLINAVLRRLAEAGPRAIEGLTGEDDWPSWLVNAWRRAYGPARAAAIAAASGEPAPLDLSVPDHAVAWAERLGGRLLPGGASVRLDDASGSVAQMPGFVEGAWWVQDAAAAVPVSLLGEVRGQRVADVCAAPGGKTMQLAAAGAEVTAVERAAGRLDRVRENLARTRLTATLIEADAAAWSPSEPFDAVLLDAPCTATGTLRRRPDVAWSKRPQDVRVLADAQAQLLARAATWLKPGGRLVFCTCSLQPEEGPQVVARVLAAGALLKPLPIRPEEAALVPQAVEPDGTLRTTPELEVEGGGGLDGFYIARFVRR